MTKIELRVILLLIFLLAAGAASKALAQTRKAQRKYPYNRVDSSRRELQRKKEYTGIARLEPRKSGVNWPNLLQHAIDRGVTPDRWFELCDMSEGGETDAVKNLGIPVALNSGGWAIDGKLNDLDIEFMVCIADGCWKDAMDAYRRMETRAREI